MPDPVCGDGLVNHSSEFCDGDQASCTFLGFDQGITSCTDDCAWELGDCSGTEVCFDGHDNDGDGLMDCLDGNDRAVQCADPCLVVVPLLENDRATGSTVGHGTAVAASCTVGGGGPTVVYEISTTDEGKLDLSLSGDVDFSLSVSTACGSVASEFICSNAYRHTLDVTVGQTLFVTVQATAAGEQGAYVLLTEFRHPFQNTSGGTTTLVPFGATWCYDATNIDPGSSWMNVSFSDSSWLIGAAQFGYGEGDESTVVQHNEPSYYFRHSFTLNSMPANASLEAFFDDGYVAYLNGIEIAQGQVANASHNSFATSFTADGRTDITSINPSRFVVGTNLLAIVIKNTSSSSSDLSFDATLRATLPAQVSMYDNFSGGEPNGEAYALYGSNGVGTWQDERCDRNRDSVCEGPPQRMDISATAPASGPWTPIDNGTNWKYEASGSNIGFGWISASYNDSSWPTGPSQLGFGYGDEATSFVNNSPSYYFRETINVPSELSSAVVDIVYDDGFAIYINGVYVDSSNVYVLNHEYYATFSSNDNEQLSIPLDPGLFVVGDNVLSLVVKNRNHSPDISFDMTLNVNLCGVNGCPPDPTWTQECVGLVGTSCDARCDTSSPPSSTGQCVGWNPGEVKVIRR